MTLDYRPRPRRPRPLRCSPTRPGGGCPRTFHQPQARSGRPSWARFPMPGSFTDTSGHTVIASEGRLKSRGPRRGTSVLLLSLLLGTFSCTHRPDPNTLVMIIESSPTNLDPRVGLDAQSERIGGLIFDDLLTRDAHLNVAPVLAEKWEVRDPLTYVFRLHHGVKFHDGRPLTSRDVKWTF